MGEDWSREEVEATVADYFEMLDNELRGLEYNKTKHRHQLATMLSMRSDGAIERKHQNISAILIKLGFPYIKGYKPLHNYQQLLYDTVSSRLENSHSMIDVVRDQVDQPADIQIFEDILKTMVEPPSSNLLRQAGPSNKVRETRAKYSINYLAREAKNHSLGMAGEKFVVEFEKARLIQAGKENLASKVEHISVTQGDSAGFDVLSYDTMGGELYIEVKTTAYGVLTPFFITGNELAVSHKSAPRYFLYRTFEFRTKPKLFAKQGPLDQSFSLEPSQYIANIA